MELKTGVEDRVLTLQLLGELDHHAAKDVTRRMELAVERWLPRQLVLDLGGVSFMDSSGLAVVLGAQKRMQLLGGSAVIRNVPPQARKVLEAANVARWIKMEEVSHEGR